VLELPSLAIFPPGALAGSVIVTVWVGAMVVAITNLRLGWVLSALVVPGYMVPLLIVNPVSATVVFAEGIVTYLLVYLYSEIAARRTGWSAFFGRDRFFALVLASVAVRLAGDGWLLPVFGAWLEREYAFAFDYRNDLHSFGLIVVALIANNFWKPGLLRGALPLAVQVGITWLITRFILVEFTNFNVQSTAVLYEDIAASMLASPKAYVILLVTAFIASRLNLKYGWEYSGILIPSLLALQWYEPVRILTTFVEAFVVLALSMLALRLPVFRTVTVEGARKIMLFFSIAFVYKFALGWTLVHTMPETKVSDWYGFGYLLATLIALKIHDHGVLGRVTMGTLQTSLLGVGVATVIGFALLLLPDVRFLQWADEQPRSAPPAPLQASLRTALLQEKTALYRARLGEPPVQPLGGELDAFAEGVRLLVGYRENRQWQALSRAQAAFAEAHYELLQTGDGHVLLREREPRRHWGTYSIALQGDPRLVVQVPAPVDEPHAYESAVWLQEALGAGGFASAGAWRAAPRDRMTDVLQSPQTIFQVFHREMAANQVLQVRAGEADQSRLHVVGGLPQGVDLNALRAVAGPFEVAFGPRRGRNLQRATTAGSFSELWLDVGSLHRAQVQPGPVEPLVRERIDGSVADLLRRLLADTPLATAGSQAYRPPLIEALIRLDVEVFGPAIEAAMDSSADPGTFERARAALGAAAGSAEALGVEVRWIVDAQGDHLILRDTTGHRGLVVLRLGQAQEYLVQVPRPLEEAGALEAALGLYQAMDARALVVAGAARDANEDLRADVLDPGNPQTFFQLAHQALLRGIGEAPGAALQVRGMAPATALQSQADGILAFDQAPTQRARLAGLAARLLEDLERTGLRLMLAADDERTVGYGAAGGPQLRYMAQTRDKRFAVLWLAGAAAPREAAGGAMR
jgi:gamma-polyglutamate biosynthesis protein CapC